MQFFPAPLQMIGSATLRGTRPTAAPSCRRGLRMRPCGAHRATRGGIWLSGGIRGDDPLLSAQELRCRARSSSLPNGLNGGPVPALRLSLSI